MRDGQKTIAEQHAAERPNFVTCVRCDGTGRNVECYDDLCHADGRCMHGNNTCALCGGHRLISEELREKWWNREAFESVGLPDADKRFRGLETSEKTEQEGDNV